MADPVKGEVALQIGDTEYTLVLNFGALVRAEKIAGKEFGVLISELQMTSMQSIEALFSAALSTRMPDLPMAKVHALIDEAGIKKVVTALLKCIESAATLRGDENPT